MMLWCVLLLFLWVLVCVLTVLIDLGLMGMGRLGRGRRRLGGLKQSCLVGLGNFGFGLIELVLMGIFGGLGLGFGKVMVQVVSLGSRLKNDLVFWGKGLEKVGSIGWSLGWELS